MTMTRARHKVRIPWLRLRKMYGELLTEHDRLQRQHRELARRWKTDYAELETLRARGTTSWATASAVYEDAVYEERIIPIPTGADKLAMVEEALDIWSPPDSDQTPTAEYPVYAVGVDPADGTDPAGISVIRVDNDGTAEVISDAE
jgi:hypothetical protein